MNFLKVNKFDTSGDDFKETFKIREFKTYLTQNVFYNIMLKLKEKYVKLEKESESMYKKNYQLNIKCIQSYINDYLKLESYNKNRFNLTNIYENEKGVKILIYFIPDNNAATISNKYLKLICQIMLYLECLECVIITQNEPSNQFKKELKLININRPVEDDPKIYRIISYTDNTFIDLTKHSYVPKLISILRNKKLKEFIALNKIKGIESFPKILISDPICKFYRCRINDVLELERESGLDYNLIDTQLIYRTVVN